MRPHLFEATPTTQMTRRLSGFLHVDIQSTGQKSTTRLLASSNDEHRSNVCRCTAIALFNQRQMRTANLPEAAILPDPQRCILRTGLTVGGRAFTRLALPPVLHWLACLANRSEHRVSWALLCSGERFTRSRVLPWPLRHGSMRCVNFELRKGT